MTDTTQQQPSVKDEHSPYHILQLSIPSNTWPMCEYLHQPVMKNISNTSLNEGKHTNREEEKSLEASPPPHPAFLDPKRVL